MAVTCLHWIVMALHSRNHCRSPSIEQAPINSILHSFGRSPIRSAHCRGLSTHTCRDDDRKFHRPTAKEDVRGFIEW